MGRAQPRRELAPIVEPHHLPPRVRTVCGLLAAGIEHPPIRRHDPLELRPGRVPCHHTSFGSFSAVR
jgi:hypothetical protein